MKLWTVFVEYSATGEGRTMMARIAHAATEAAAIADFQAKFGEFFGLQAQAKEGVVENHVTTFLFTAAALALARRLDGAGFLVVEGQHYFNLS